MGHSVSDDNEKNPPSSHHHTDEMPSVHKVRLPPQQKLYQEFTSTLKETFFADDPLRSFKNQSKSRKLILSLQALFPILEWGRHYNLKKFRGDLIAGLTIASLCIPQVDISLLVQPNVVPKLKKTTNMNFGL